MQIKTLTLHIQIKRCEQKIGCLQDITSLRHTNLGVSVYARSPDQNFLLATMSEHKL